MRYDHFSMLPIRAFQGVAGRMTYEGGGGKGDAPDAPDYTPLAQASEKAAQIGAELGREQLAEATRQYEKNLEVATPIVNAQLDLMNQNRDTSCSYKFPDILDCVSNRHVCELCRIAKTIH